MHASEVNINRRGMGCKGGGWVGGVQHRDISANLGASTLFLRPNCCYTNSSLNTHSMLYHFPSEMHANTRS